MMHHGLWWKCWTLGPIYMKGIRPWLLNDIDILVFWMRA